MHILNGELIRYARMVSLILVVLVVFVAEQSFAEGKTIIAPGKILIANEALSDPNFDSTIVLIVGHNPLGTLGLVINQPLETNQPSPLAPRFRPNIANDVIYFGGPVSAESLRVLAASRFDIPEAIHIVGDVYFFDSAESFAPTPENEPETDHRTNAIRTVRVYRGISSWIPGQLAAEIRAGAWYVRDGSEDIIFTENERLWEQFISEIHSQWVQLNNRINSLPDISLPTYNKSDTEHFAEK